MLTPEIIDLLVIANIVIGIALASYRFMRDLRRPLPAEAPAWARARCEAPAQDAASDSS